MRVVLDTNVIVAALRSSNGASFQLLKRLGNRDFEVALSVPLVLEYESVLMRMLPALGLVASDVADMLDYLCSVARSRQVHFLWRPQLPDPKDEMVLELAVSASAALVTHNQRDFQGVAEKFGIAVMTPQMLLSKLKVKP